MSRSLFDMLGLEPTDIDLVGRVSCEHCMVEEATNNMFVPQVKSCGCLIYFNVGKEFSSSVRFVDLPEWCVVIYDEE